MTDEANIQTRVKSVLEDPSARAVARVYADAVLESAAAPGVDETLEEFASFLDDVLAVQPELSQLLTSGIVGRDDKIRLIDKIVAPFGSELFTNFLRVLARHDRLELLPLILEESRVQHELRTGRRRVRVQSAVPLSEDARKRLERRLTEAFHFEPVLDIREVPGILGGLVIQVGDTVYDGSLRTRVKQLRDRLRQRSLHEVQSGRDRFSHPAGD